MSKKIFTSDQIRKLSKNPNISHCGGNTVRYRAAFKQEAMRQYEAGLSAVEIFQNAGIDLDIIGKRSPNHLMCQWRTALRAKSGEKVDPLTRPNNDLEKLRAQVAYLKAENDFLAKIRAKKKGR